MSFKMNEFIISNLKNGYMNKSFTQEQVNVFAMNYWMRGNITQEEFQEIIEFVDAYEFEEVTEVSEGEETEG